MKNYLEQAKKFDIPTEEIKKMEYTSILSSKERLSEMLKLAKEDRQNLLQDYFNEIFFNERGGTDIEAKLSGSSSGLTLYLYVGNNGIECSIREDLDDETKLEFTISAINGIREYNMSNVNADEVATLKLLCRAVTDERTTNKIYDVLVSAREYFNSISAIRRKYIVTANDIKQSAEYADKILEINVKQHHYICELKKKQFIPEQIRLRIFENSDALSLSCQYFIYKNKLCLIVEDSDGKWARDTKGKRDVREEAGYKDMWAMAENLKYKNGTLVFGNDFFK